MVKYCQGEMKATTSVCPNSGNGRRGDPKSLDWESACGVKGRREKMG